MIWLGLLISLVSVPGITGAYGVTAWAALSIVLPYGLWRRGEVTPLHWLGFTFLACATIAMAWAPIYYDAVWALWLLWIIGLGFWLGSTCFTLQDFYRGLALGLGVSSLLAIAQYPPWFHFTGILQNNNTPSGLFFNSAILGQLAALVIIALLSEGLWRWTLLPLPGLYLAQSRVAWLALAIFAIPALIRSRALCILTGAASVAALALFWRPELDAQRVTIWRFVATHLTTFGHGPGSLTSIYLLSNGSPIRPEYAHNEALDLAYQFGLFALLPFAILSLLLLQGRGREWFVVGAGACLALFSFPLHSAPLALTLALASGRSCRAWYVARCVRRYERSFRVARIEPTNGGINGDTFPL